MRQATQRDASVFLFLPTLSKTSAWPPSLSYGHRRTTPEWHRRTTPAGQCLRRTTAHRDGIQRRRRGFHSAGEEVAGVAWGLRVSAHRAGGKSGKHHWTQGRADKEDVRRNSISHSRSRRSSRHSWSNCMFQLHQPPPPSLGFPSYPLLFWFFNFIFLFKNLIDTLQKSLVFCFCFLHCLSGSLFCDVYANVLSRLF